MTNCPCCGYKMVKTFRHRETVSFCRHCWQEMPDFVLQDAYALLKRQSLERAIQQPIAQVPKPALPPLKDGIKS